MTPERFNECLSIIRWTDHTLAAALGCDLALVEAWATGEIEVPMKLSAWIETNAKHHEAFEKLKPVSLKGKKRKP